jgi:hypothetical protein
MTAENAGSGQTPENKTARLPFDAEFMQLVEMFCSTALMNVPELHGVAIVPIWETQPEKFPAGLLQLRNTQPPFLASLLQLSQRLAIFATDVQKDMVGQLRVFDQYAAELSEQISKNIETLNAQKESQPPQPPAENG